MSSTRSKIASLSLVLVLAALAAGCGSKSDSKSDAAGNATDAAFVADMVPHHTNAVEMARIAQRRGQHAEIRGLADDIVSSQQAEVALMKRLGKGLPHEGHDGGMGMSGMSNSHMDPARLRTAKTFDREFMDMMIPHHESAVRMATVELGKGAQPELRRLARRIISAQRREISQMRAWRASWYGAKSGASMPAHHG